MSALLRRPALPAGLGSPPVGFLLVKIKGQPVNLLSRFTVAEAAAIQASTSSTDHQFELADVFGNESDVHIPAGKFNASALITVTSRLNIQAQFGALIKWVDGNYTGIRVTGSAAQYSSIEGLRMWSDNTSGTALFQALQVDTAAAYFTLSRCNFAYARQAVVLNGVYVVKAMKNEYSNCKTYLNIDDSLAGTADILLDGETYGTSNFGSESLIIVAAPGVRIANAYFESQNHTKLALDILTGAQSVLLSGSMDNSGGIRVQSSCVLHMNCVDARDVFDSATLRGLRIDGGGAAYVNGGRIALSQAVASLSGVSNAGDCNISGTAIVGLAGHRWAAGILSGGSGRLAPSIVGNCDTGISLTSGATNVVARDVTYSGNTTDLSNASGGSAVAPGNFTGAITGCATTPAPFCRYEVDNGTVRLTIGAATGTSNANTMTMTGLPACIRPAAGQFASAAYITDNGTSSWEQCDVTGSVVTFRKGASSTGFTTSGTKGVAACTITYRLVNA